MLYKHLSMKHLQGVLGADITLAQGLKRKLAKRFFNNGQLGGDLASKGQGAIETIKTSTQHPGEKTMTTTSTTLRGIMITDYTTLRGIMLSDYAGNTTLRGIVLGD